MPSGTELVLDKNKRVLIYGRSGSGKTSMVGKVLECSSMLPLYVFDFDLRINSILAVVSDTKLLGTLSFDQYRDTTQAGKAFTDAEAKVRQLGQAITKGNGPKTIAVDSLTFMEKSIMARILAMDGKSRTDSASLQHYKAIIPLIENFISQLCSLDANIIVTAHEDADKDEVTGQMVRGLGITGKKLPTILPGYFNELWYAEVVASPNQKPSYRVRVAPTNQIMARTVYSNYLDVTEGQDIWQKLAKIDAERTIG